MTERRQRHRPDPSDVELDEPAPTHTPVYAIARVDLEATDGADATSAGE